MANEEERVLENQLEQHLNEQRDSLTALNDAVASDPFNPELQEVICYLVIFVFVFVFFFKYDLICNARSKIRRKKIKNFVSLISKLLFG